ncbi:MAG: sugar dehydrogenase [Segetibacter sp.]|nr:sugar dehydrogenase [Segetibacter sp.]
MDKKLKGQCAIVTGASSGIGQAIAIELALNGADVAINFHSNDEGAADTLQQVQNAGAKGILIKADVGREAEVLRMYEEVYKEFNTVDILISNAGIQKDNPITEMSLEDWQAVLDTNLTAGFLCAREAIKEFQKRSIPQNEKRSAGKIVFISSVHDIIPWGKRTNYTASKGGISMFMKSLALEVAAKKIRVNSISPGAIRTNINDESWKDPEEAKKMLDLIPYKRIGDPEDVAKAAAWLCSDDADYITGATLYIDGGMTLYPSFEEGA